jgi:hypothetical protein
MANTFKTVTFAAEPASAGTPYVMYTVGGSTTTVVLGLVLANIHTTSVTTEVELVRIPSGSSLEVLSGSKVILETGDKIQIDCSVADKLSGTLSIMEIT